MIEVISRAEIAATKRTCLARLIDSAPQRESALFSISSFFNGKKLSNICAYILIINFISQLKMKKSCIGIIVIYIYLVLYYTRFICFGFV